MDFDMLTRRELQTLCKRNKINANVTNVAMADALKSLEIVDGMEELLNPRESETSPYLPPAGGRSTRRRNLAKEEPKTVTPMTRTRRTERKTLDKDANGSQVEALETPATVSKANIKKAQMASACRKMDSQLKECVDEANKDVLVTPAPSGVTSRRRVLKEESTVKRVYSTRRSARLAEKNMVLMNEKVNESENSSVTFKKDLFAKDKNVEINSKESLDCVVEANKDVLVTPAPSGVTSRRRVLKEESTVKRVYSTRRSARLAEKNMVLMNEKVNESENSVTSKDLFAKDKNVEMNPKESLDCSDEISEITGIDENTMMGENSDKRDEVEVVSAEEKHVSIACEAELSTKVEEMSNSFEASGSKVETKEGGDAVITLNYEKKYEGEVTAENPEKNEEIKVVSAQEHDISVVSEAEHVSTMEEETINHFEADSYKPEMEEVSEVEITSNFEKKDEVKIISAIEQDISIDREGELVSSREDKTGNYFEANVAKPEAKEVRDIDVTLNSEEIDEGEVISAQEQIISIVGEEEPVSTIEEETDNHFEADGSKPEQKDDNDVEITFNSKEKNELEVVSAQEQDVSVVSEVELLSTIEEETGHHSEVDGSKEVKEGSDVENEEVDKQKCDTTEDIKDENIVMPLNVSTEVQESDVSHDTCSSEVHISVESVEELLTNRDVGSEEKAAECVENVVHESEDDFVADEVSCDTDIQSEIDEEIYNDKEMNSEEVAEVNVNEKVMEIKSQAHVDVSDMVFNPENSTESITMEAKEESSNAIIQKTDNSMANMAFDISLMSEEEEAKMKLNVSDWNAVFAELTEKCDTTREKNEGNLVEHTKLEMEKETEISLPEIGLGNVAAAAEETMPLDTFCLTPIKNSASKSLSATKKRMSIAVSDNKENIGSGGKLVLTKERVIVPKSTAENVPKSNGLSKTKLSKMMRELQITNKSSENENGNEAPDRPALRALPENQ